MVVKFYLHLIYSVCGSVSFLEGPGCQMRSLPFTLRLMEGLNFWFRRGSKPRMAGLLGVGCVEGVDGGEGSRVPSGWPVKPDRTMIPPAAAL